MMWILILGAVAAGYVAGLLYISFRSAGALFMKKLTKDKRKTARLLCLAFYILLTVVLWLFLGIFNAIISMIHLYVFWLLCDLIGTVLIKILKKKPRRYYAGGAAALLCAVYLTYGWISAHNVRQTFYGFTSPKLTSQVRIVQITDSHIGATFDGEGFLRYIEEINGLSPDAVVVTGDFVDDDTSKSDMLTGCDALGRLSTKYGVYYVWGNHDKGYFSERSRGWSVTELREKLKENGVIILEDESRLIADSFYITGRLDRSASDRKSAAELVSPLDKSKYIVMLDHQPHDFDAEAEAGADLVLCGHTHGGQLIPINHVGEWIGENCLRYGHEKRLGTDFIVSSGISNWALKFKTGCFSEYVIIDLKPE